jgi:hypothetical protein
MYIYIIRNIHVYIHIRIPAALVPIQLSRSSSPDWRRHLEVLSFDKGTTSSGQLPPASRNSMELPTGGNLPDRRIDPVPITRDIGTRVQIVQPADEAGVKRTAEELNAYKDKLAAMEQKFEGCKAQLDEKEAAVEQEKKRADECEQRERTQSVLQSGVHPTVPEHSHVPETSAVNDLSDAPGTSGVQGHRTAIETPLRHIGNVNTDDQLTPAFGVFPVSSIQFLTANGPSHQDTPTPIGNQGQDSRKGRGSRMFNEVQQSNQIHGKRNR